MTTTTMFIPKDVIDEILSQLPAKCLLLLRWACKYLFDLITRDDDFIKLHLHRSTSTSDHDYSVLSSASSVDTSVPKYNYHGYLNYTTGSLSCNQKKFDCPVEPCKLCNRSENSTTCINGLLFFCIKQDLMDSTFCIWNPCTNEYRMLSVPDPPMFIKAKQTCLGKYGFGYDHTINDYKVVRHDYYYDDGHNNLLASDVQIYTVGTNSWRSIGPAPYEQPAEPVLEGGVFVNGALHWLLDPLGEKIVSFDIGKEEYKQVLVKQLQPAESSDGIWECTKELQVFEGSLCCLVKLRINDHKHFLEIWMMKDFNNEYSWNKLFRTSEAYRRCPMLLRSTQDDEILYCSTGWTSTQNGEILMLTQCGELVVYDPKTDTRRPVNRICTDGKCYHVIETVYTESLVSLSSGTYIYGGSAAYLKNKKRKNEQR